MPPSVTITAEAFDNLVRALDERDTLRTTNHRSWGRKISSRGWITS